MTAPEQHSDRPKEAERLDKFLGEWRVDGTLEMDGRISPLSGTWKFTKIADGWGVAAEMDTTIEGIGSIQETVLIGYDSEHGKIRHFSMNKLAVRDHIGTWENQDTLVVVYKESSGGEDHSETITIRFGSEQITGAVVEKVNDNVIIVTNLTLTILQ